MKSIVWSIGAALAFAVAAAAPTGEPVVEGMPGADELVRQLGDDSYVVRERASRALWGLGDDAVEILKRALLSDDPEVVFRARELVNKIDIGILPDTSPEVQELVRAYFAADDRLKSTIIIQLHLKRAWRQVMKLYEREADPEVRAGIRPTVGVASLAGAREAVVEGDLEKALDYLEMAPHDSEGLAAWASYKAALGQAQAEIEKLDGVAGELAALRRMALMRVSGDLRGAASAAETAGETGIAAAMELVLGNPVPWLELPVGDEGRTFYYEAYIRWAVDRWRTGVGDRKLIDSIIESYKDADSEDRWAAAGALFLAGRVDEACEWYGEMFPNYAFSHYESTEQMTDALKLYGIDPEQPDLRAWSKDLIEKVLADPDESEKERKQLFLVCGAFDSRGRTQEVNAVLAAYLDPLAKEDSELFLGAIGEMFSPLVGLVKPAIAAAERYAGEDPDLWRQIAAEAVEAAPDFVGGKGTEVWNWVSEAGKELKGVEQVRVLAALFGVLPGETELRAAWLARLRKDADGAKGKERERLLGLLLDLARTGTDLDVALPAARDLAKGDAKHEQYGPYLMLLSAAEEWEEAVEAWRLRVELLPRAPHLRAYLAAVLRRTGKEDEAREQEVMIGRMALGDGETCIRIGHGYAYAGDFERAEAWSRRALVESVPGSESWVKALEKSRIVALESKDWMLAAALGEAVVLEWMRGGNVYYALPARKLRARFDADLARAMSRLKEDREGALAMLRHCHEMLSSDGSIADHFLPALRDAGLIEEHDRCFEESWGLLDRAIRRYPDSDNTCNTAAWIAARANRRLGEAQVHLEHALAIKPNQAAYLDTMAELWFARGDREQAVEWSLRAVAATPEDELLRRQLERFRSEEFPEG